MPNKRLTREKQALVLGALCEGTPVNAVCRMFGVGKNSVLRVIRETGEAFADYMDKSFRDLPCARIELDEQWQYVGCHKGRMVEPRPGMGDFWLWGAIDADTKLVFSYRVGKRDWITGNMFVEDVSNRVRRPVQIATDNLPAYPFHIRQYFGYEGISYGTETKIFGEPELPDGTLARLGRNEGVRRMVTAERKAVVGSPDLETLTTSHIERLFLTVRQELKRFERRGLGYSKDLAMHKAAIALTLGVYNFVRRHKGLDGQTPAQAAGIEQDRWSLERVVEMTEAYWQPKYEAEKAAKAQARREAEDAVFLKALAWARGVVNESPPDKNVGLHSMQRKLLFAISCTVVTAVMPAFGQLDRCLEAHGGLSKWRGLGGVEYDRKLVGQALGRLLYTKVHFSKEAPKESRFTKPADAIIAPL